MNVAHVISSGGFFGAERVLLNIADGMRGNKGVAPLVVAIANAHNPHLEIIAEAKNRGLATAIVESRGRWDPKAVFSLGNLAIEQKIDIIHSHNYKANLVAALASRRINVPLVATNHLWTGGDLKLRFYELLDGFILGRYARKVVAVAGTIKKDMMRCGVKEAKIEVIFNGIDPDRALENGYDLRREFFISSSAIVIGVVARLSPEKGHRFLFKAAQSLMSEFPELVFLVVGEGALKESLQLSVAGLHLKDRVIFTGYRKDMGAVYKTIDILIQSSRGEGLPMTLLEAMSLGKPIIATDVGATSDVIRNNDTGLLIHPGSASELAEALKKLLKDASLRQQYGENARRVVAAEFSLEKMLLSYRKIYEDVLTGVNT